MELSPDYSNMEKLQNKTITEFTELIASKAPAPGGGGASALVAAIGISLGDMVGEFTVGKKKYIDVEPEIIKLMERSQEIRKKLLALVDQDAEMFEPLSRAYGIPKEDPARDEILEKCLKDAAKTPLEIFDLCLESIDILKEFGEKGLKLMLSDAATGAVHVWGAMYGAAVNVKVNTKLMKDRTYADKINTYIDTQMEKYWKIAEKVYEDVYSTL